MKLRNKKTGDIGEVGYLATSDGKIIVNNIKDKDEWYEYNSLAKLNEEWEDYEEPNEFWFINDCGEVRKYEYNSGCSYPIVEAKLIGNYFETKEEAEKAVEKLKAWKRLKKLGFRFIGETCEYKSDKHFGSVFFETNGYALDVYEDSIELYDDLDLLFGGEE